ncbi:MAG: purine-nucleoside phosphorylase [Rhizobiaceae bacterium]|nr:purine-nucleoside phosphorylase [Rhizobiaceae bacterium]
MTPHNEAKAGDYAETVLLPGDPLRAKWIAETFMADARQVNGVRNCLGFTGTYKGRPVSVQATGMGQASASIYIHELINMYGARTLIRVGTCGGLNARVKVGDLVLAQAACTNSGMIRDAFVPYSFAPIADFGLLRAMADKAETRKLRLHVGNMVADDIFYHPNGLDGYGALPAHGVLAVDMESAALYTLAARFGVRALTVCTMSDCLITHEEMSAQHRQTALVDMATLALDVAAET